METAEECGQQGQDIPGLRERKRVNTQQLLGSFRNLRANARENEVPAHQITFSEQEHTMMSVERLLLCCRTAQHIPRFSYYVFLQKLDHLCHFKGVHKKQRDTLSTRAVRTSFKLR